MKKFDADRPGYGLFELPTTTNEMKPSLAYAAERFPNLVAAAYPRYEQAQPRMAAPAGSYGRFGKRILDTVLIVLTLPFALPVIALCALALWLEGGAPFYTQPRLGRGGKRFSIIKLRTMVRDADAVLENYLTANPAMRREWDDIQKLKDDPRVTTVGRFLRATSLDELPQLFNVLTGDMSLVGPRPMMPDQLGMYGDSRAYFALRPGITGLWQISARNNNKFVYRNEVDAAYKQGFSLRMDLTILVKTVGVVLRRTGC